eukprot:gene13759-4682_t
MGIIKNFEVFYCKRLLSKLIRATEEKKSDDFTVNVLECLRWSKSVWENGVTQETIANCFKKAGFQKELSEGQDESGTADTQEENLGNLFEHLADLQYFSAYENHLVNDFTNIDEELVTSSILTSSEIAKEIKDQRQSPATEDEDEGDEELDFANGTDPVPSAIDGANAVQLLQRFFEFSDLPNADEALKMLSKIDAEINNIWVKKTIQKHITDFFKPCNL